MEFKKYVHPDNTNFYQSELSIQQAFELEKLFSEVPKIADVLTAKGITVYEFISMLMETHKLLDTLKIILTGANDAPLTEEQITKLSTLKYNQVTTVFADFFTLNPGNTTLFGSTATAAALQRIPTSTETTSAGANQNSQTLKQNEKIKEPSVN